MLIHQIFKFAEKKEYVLFLDEVVFYAQVASILVQSTAVAAAFVLHGGSSAREGLVPYGQHISR